eukprot:1161145-Pelagomonas_calceolata.AAC.3
MYGKLLPLLDNFERAAETLKVVTRTEGEQAVHDVYQKGVAEPIRETLSPSGIEALAASQFEHSYDPQGHREHEHVHMHKRSEDMANHGAVVCAHAQGHREHEHVHMHKRSEDTRLTNACTHMHTWAQRT